MICDRKTGAYATRWGGKSVDAPDFSSIAKRRRHRDSLRLIPTHRVARLLHMHIAPKHRGNRIKCTVTVIAIADQVHRYLKANDEDYVLRCIQVAP
jgi:hypothetical protein